MTRRPGSYADEETLAQELLEQEADKAKAAAEAGAPEAKPEEAAKPETWEDRLKAAGLTPEQGLQILDAMIERGYYEKTFPLYGGRRTLVLRTRDGYSRQRVSNALDALRTNDPRVHYQTTMRLCLAGSLVQFGKKTLPFSMPDADLDAQETAFNERLKFLDSIGDPFLDTLYAQLTQFDRWTFAALSNGAPSGF